MISCVHPAGSRFLADLQAAVRRRGLRKTARDLSWSTSGLSRRLASPDTLSFLEACLLAQIVDLPIQIPTAAPSQSVSLQSPAELPFAPPI